MFETTLVFILVTTSVSYNVTWLSEDNTGGYFYVIYCLFLGMHIISGAFTSVKLHIHYHGS